MPFLLVIVYKVTVSHTNDGVHKQNLYSLPYNVKMSQDFEMCLDARIS